MRPSWSTYSITISDGAAYSLFARDACRTIAFWERPTVAGYPRNLLVTGNSAGSTRGTLPGQTVQVVPGSFQTGDLVAILQLPSSGGDTTTVDVQELQ